MAHEANDLTFVILDEGVLVIELIAALAAGADHLIVVIGDKGDDGVDFRDSCLGGGNVGHDVGLSQDVS